MRSNTVFSQLLQLIYQYRFKKCIDRFEGEKYTKRFNDLPPIFVLLLMLALNREVNVVKVIVHN